MSAMTSPRQPTVTSPASSAGGAALKNSVMIGSKPSLVSVEPLRFLIMDAPRQSNLHLYIRECRKHHVTDIVRVCEPTYHGGELQNAGIKLHEMAYEDGHSPPKELIDRWLALVDETFYRSGRSSSSGNADARKSASNGSDGTATSSVSQQAGAPLAAVSSATSSPTIAVHCVAGLGRAPVLVALALIEFARMDPVDSVALIRRHRRGAINEKQLIYLEGYKRQYKRSRSGDSDCCVIL